MALSGVTAMVSRMTGELIAVDIGGTNARFCRARIGKEGEPELGTIRKYRVADHPGLADAWRAFARDEERALPTRAVIALAAPVERTPIKLTNSPWIVDPAALKEQLGLDRLLLVNDFVAMAHGVTAMSRQRLCHLFGPDSGLPDAGTTSVIGPGTGLGVAVISKDANGTRILATEGGHMDFAAVDETDDALLTGLRQRFGRVSVERVVSGPGLGALYHALAAVDGRKVAEPDDAQLWRSALDGGDELAVRALDRLCRSYGTVAGDLALAHGARCVVLAGGLTGRMKQFPAFAKAFHDRFVAKGRYRAMMGDLPVYFADHPEAGLFGAAAAGLAGL